MNIVIFDAVWGDLFFLHKFSSSFIFLYHFQVSTAFLDPQESLESRVTKGPQGSRASQGLKVSFEKLNKKLRTNLGQTNFSVWPFGCLCGFSLALNVIRFSCVFLVFWCSFFGHMCDFRFYHQLFLGRLCIFRFCYWLVLMFFFSKFRSCVADCSSVYFQVIADHSLVVYVCVFLCFLLNVLWLSVHF